VLRGFVYPVGPDGPVYLWWTRLSAVDGLSVVERPGTMAFLGVLRWIGVGLPASVAGVECALGAGVGLGAAALVRAGGASRVAWALAGALAGTFATHLASGYVSNLVFAVPFLAAVVVLGERSRRATVAAALLLGAGGLAHPLFLAVGVAIVLGAGVLAYPSATDETRRAVAACVGGAVILGAGALAMLAGPPIARVDTSQDAFLRRAGLGDTLAHAYRYRFVHRWTRYVEWASVPLAAFAVREPQGWVARALWSWFGVTVAGVVVGFVTGWFPADRFVTFGYAIPVLAALGVVTIARRLRRRPTLAFAIAGALCMAMIAGSGIAWLREKPYLGASAVADVGVAARYASASPPGTPWIVPVDSPSQTVSFLATRLQNVIRDAVPEDRILDVYVVAPPPPAGLPADRRLEWSTLARLYARDAATAARAAGGAVVIDIAPFRKRAGDRPPVCEAPACEALDAPERTVATGVAVSASAAAASPAPADSTLASSTTRVAVAAPLVLVILTVVGLGWSALVARDPATALALAPGFGTAAIVLGGVIADRLGVRLSSAGHGLPVLMLVALLGYAALVAERRRSPHPAP
jgi:hypothetical protein